MKKLIYIPIIFIFFSCSKKLILTNKMYVSGDSIKVSTLHFINDSICNYEQKYLCEIEEPYKNTVEICHYHIQKNSIILKNLTKDPDSIGTTYFKIPASELDKCSFFNEKLTDNEMIILGAPRALSNTEMFGFINNITDDTLLYRRKVIIYQKFFNLVPYPMFVIMSFYEKPPSE